MVRKLLATYIIFIVLPLTTVSAISFLLFKTNMEQQISSSMERTMTLLHREVDQYFHQFLDLSESIMFQRNLLDIIHQINLEQAGQANGFESYQRAGEINVYITFQLLNKFREIAAVHLFTKSEELFHARRSGAILDKALLQSYQDQLLDSGEQWIYLQGERNGNAIYLIRRINEPFTGKYIALLTLEIQLDTLRQKIVSALLPNQHLVLLGKPELVVHDPADIWRHAPVHNPGSELTSLDIDGPEGRTLVTYATVPASEWSVVSYTAYSSLSQYVNRISVPMLIVSAICILLSIFTAGVIAKRIVRPIRAIRNAMRKLAAGNFKIEIPVLGKDEVADLSRGFNQMSRQLVDTINQMYVVELAQRNAELRALQAQIDPHFLYNTLDAIRMVAEMEGSSNAGEMVSSLAALFRAATGSDTMVTVEQELNLVRHYAKLREIRFDGEFALRIHADPKSSDCLIPKFALQPIVENAFNHGLLPMRPPRTGLIEIKSHCSGDQVVIEVRDNGVGMEEEALRRLLDRLDSTESVEQSVGVRNVHNRIRLKWGDQFGVSISSKPGFGTVVIVKIPAMKEDT